MKKSYIAGGIALALGVAGLVAPVFAVTYTTGTQTLDLTTIATDLTSEIRKQFVTDFTTNNKTVLKVDTFSFEDLGKHVKHIKAYLDSDSVSVADKNNYKKALKNIKKIEATAAAGVVAENKDIEAFLSLKSMFNSDFKFTIKTSANGNIDFSKVSDANFDAIFALLHESTPSTPITLDGTGKFKTKSKHMANTLVKKNIVPKASIDFAAPSIHLLEHTIEQANALLAKVNGDDELKVKHKDKAVLLKAAVDAAIAFKGNIAAEFNDAEDVKAVVNDLNNYITLLDNEIKGVKPETQKPQGNANTNNTTKPNKVSNSGSAN